jgi:hypothetical protein
MLNKYPNATIRVNPDEIEGLGIRIKGIKVAVECLRCGKTWALWFRTEEDFIEHLNPRWYYCANCDGEVFPTE